MCRKRRNFGEDNDDDDEIKYNWNVFGNTLLLWVKNFFCGYQRTYLGISRKFYKTFDLHLKTLECVYQNTQTIN